MNATSYSVLGSIETKNTNAPAGITNTNTDKPIKDPDSFETLRLIEADRLHKQSRAYQLIIDMKYDMINALVKKWEDQIDILNSALVCLTNQKKGSVIEPLSHIYYSDVLHRCCNGFKNRNISPRRGGKQLVKIHTTALLGGKENLLCLKSKLSDEDSRGIKENFLKKEIEGMQCLMDYLDDPLVLFKNDIVNDDILLLLMNHLADDANGLLCCYLQKMYCKVKEENIDTTVLDRIAHIKKKDSWHPYSLHVYESKVSQLPVKNKKTLADWVKKHGSDYLASLPSPAQKKDNNKTLTQAMLTKVPVFPKALKMNSDLEVLDDECSEDEQEIPVSFFQLIKEKEPENRTQPQQPQKSIKPRKTTRYQKQQQSPEASTSMPATKVLCKAHLFEKEATLQPLIREKHQQTFLAMSNRSYPQAVTKQRYLLMLQDFLHDNLDSGYLLNCFSLKKDLANQASTQKDKIFVGDGVSLRVKRYDGVRAFLTLHYAHGRESCSQIPKEYRQEYMSLFDDLAITAENCCFGKPKK